MMYIIRKKSPAINRAVTPNQQHYYMEENFSLILLPTTLTLLKAIAAPAIIGFKRNPFTENKIPAAIGIPIML